MSLIILSGGPGTGKTSVLNEFKKQGYKIIKEAARTIGGSKEFSRKSINQINKKRFQKAIFELQKKQIEKLKKEKSIVFLDRSLIDTIAYYNLLDEKTPREFLDFAEKSRYSKVFIMDFLKDYKKDKLRKETKEEQEIIQEEIIKTYKKFKYKPIIVPFMSVEERVSFIKSKIR